MVIVNQTNIEASQGGLYAAKALIPGMTPITFGYGSCRLKGISRVYELPHQMGYTDHVLTPEELNSNCHPFS